MPPPLIYIEPRGGSKILRIRAPFCLLRRHFPYQGNPPALPCKLYFVRVGAIHESPAVFAPSERGLSNAQHLTGGEIFPFLSLRLLPAAKATSLIRGRSNGSSRRRPLQTGARGDPPDCHSEPIGEESRFARVYFLRLEILRFAQDDKYTPHFIAVQ